VELAGRSAREIVDRASPWLIGAVVAAPVLVCRYPAMVDLPCHEEVVAAMRHFQDPSSYAPGLMTWNVGHPNQLFYFVALALSFVVPVDVACKLVVAASVAGIPIGAARLAAHAGVSRWAAAFAAPVALGFCFYFGFVGNLLGIGMLLAALPALDRFATTPTARGAATTTAVLVALYLSHDSALVMGILALAILSLARPLGRYRIAWTIVPLAVAGGVALVEEVYVVRHRPPNIGALPRVIDLGLTQKIRGLPEALLGLRGASACAAAFWAFAIALALLALQKVLALRRAGGRSPRWSFERDRFLVLGVALGVAYFEVPFAYTGAMWLHARFLGPAVIVLAVALAPSAPVAPWWPTRLVCVGALAALLRLVVPSMVETARVYSDLDALLSTMDTSAVASLDVIGGPGSRLVFSPSGAAARAASVHGGRMAASFTQSSPIPPVVISPDHRWDDSFVRLARDTLAFEPARDLRRFRYVLAWTLPAQVGSLIAALAPEARLIGRSGGWLLFESTLSVVPLTAPDELPVDPDHADTLRARLATRR
jgi:hypothetical protein